MSLMKKSILRDSGYLSDCEEKTMFETNNDSFFEAIDKLVLSGKIVIDRPRGSTHPRFPGIKYDIDYGYI